MKKLLLLILVTLSIQSFSQKNTYDIYFPQADRQSKCGYFFNAFQSKPKEVSFGITREGENLYFEINDKQWFDLLFKKTGDGIAVDIVSKKRYNCDVPVNPQQIRGLLLAPVYAMKLKKAIKKTHQDRFRVLVGKIPASLKEEVLEFNILFLHNRALCQYYTIYNLPSYAWDLLDMGVYLDSLTYKNQKITTINESVVTKYKKLKFTVPFEKNKSVYEPDDIKPMYDSLSLTNFNIKKIDIKAYASVEGSEERNLALQNERATSIANALQTFQQPNIETLISSSENWVEFLKDIENSKYINLASLSKQEVKEKLRGNLSLELESILKNHRKAVVTLSLEKKDRYKKLKIEELIPRFNKAIEEDNIEEASIIQNSLLNKIREKSLPDEISKLKIPKQKKYINLLSKNSITKYLINVAQTLIAKNELEKLEKLDPKNKNVKYNLAVLEFAIWKNRALPVDKKVFKQQILALKNVGIVDVLINKMLVNYHIIKAQEDMQSRKYDEKDISVEFILDRYKKVSLSNYDYLSLAQFLTYYSNTKEALSVLENKVNEITVDEDLLFYYLNLTLTDKNLTNTPSYKKTLLNAVNMNKKRFCSIFNSSLDNGVTFQLLENIDLRVMYCENCN